MYVYVSEVTFHFTQARGLCCALYLLKLCFYIRFSSLNNNGVSFFFPPTEFVRGASVKYDLHCRKGEKEIDLH